MYFVYNLFKIFMLISDISGRDALGSTDDATKVDDLIKPLNALSAAKNEQQQGCRLHVNKDFSNANELQPLYLVSNSSRFWPPDENGELLIPYGVNIELFCCSQAFRILTANDNHSKAAFNDDTRFKIMPTVGLLRPYCLHGKRFQWLNDSYELKQFACSRRLPYAIERTNVSCVDLKPLTYSTSGIHTNPAQLYRIGYRLDRLPFDRFIETMSVCYDETLLVTHYVQHDLRPGNSHFQKAVKRIKFSQIGYFQEWNLNYLYSQYNQREQIQKLFPHGHQEMTSKGFIYLTRGHLAAKTDFIYATQQRTTFNFFNIAPQWQTFNSGQWSTLENEVRKFITASNLHVRCYTGTWGILEWPSGILNPTSPANESRKLYLGRDANNNAILPVPRLFYRILIDIRALSNATINHEHLGDGRGIVLIGVNNPYVTIHEIHAAYTICKDIRKEVDWLHWIRNDNLKKGYLYACRVSEFAKVVQHLPKYLLDFNEILK